MQTKTNYQPMQSAHDYVTIVVQASAKAGGFKQLYKEMERSFYINGKSRSTLNNYGQQLAP